MVRAGPTGIVNRTAVDRFWTPRGGFFVQAETPFHRGVLTAGLRRQAAGGPAEFALAMTKAALQRPELVRSSIRVARPASN